MGLRGSGTCVLFATGSDGKDLHFQKHWAGAGKTGQAFLKGRSQPLSTVLPSPPGVAPAASRGRGGARTDGRRQGGRRQE